MTRRMPTSLIAVAIVCIAIAISSLAARASPTPMVDDRMVPVLVDGERVRLAVRIFRPDGEGPFPTLIFHHGSTGWGTKPERFAESWLPGTLINYFVDRGWAVILPSRRGRGGSEGIYDEGFDPDRRKGYSIKPKYSLPGADRALADVDAITDVILAMPFVDATTVIASGGSRGGILSIAHAGQRPDLYKGVINFVGGWLGGTWHDAKKTNNTLFKRGVPFGEETLWLYATDDSYYSLSTTRGYFKEFEKAGGRGTFVDDFPGQIGHGLVDAAEYWGPVVDAYLDRLGLPHEATSSALRFTPNPSPSPDAFVGEWAGWWGGFSTWPTAPFDFVRISRW